MMKNFMTSGSHARDKEFEEDPGRRDVMPFPEEDVVMKVYDGYPPFGEAPHVHPKSQDPESLRLGTQGHRGWETRFTIYIYTYICMYVYYNYSKRRKK
jgi:hypothetical protein